MKLFDREIHYCPFCGVSFDFLQIEAKEDKRGVWIEDDAGIHCSECWKHVEEKSDYCPCCGTRMSREEEENENELG